MVSQGVLPTVEMSPRFVAASVISRAVKGRFDCLRTALAAARKVTVTDGRAEPCGQAGEKGGDNTG